VCEGYTFGVESAELMLALMELAQKAELEVRTLGATGGAQAEAPVASGVCRVRGEVWVLLSASDPLDVRLEVLADALKTHRGEWLEGVWLPPAVRNRLD
jgi:hypothetical protein